MTSSMLIVTLLWGAAGGMSVEELIRPPPVLSMGSREWKVPDNVPVGWIVTSVSSDDLSRSLEFGLERCEDYCFGLKQHAQDLPFTIDRETGVVTTNQTLVGRAGENMFFYVTVSDGHLPQKTVVRAVIQSSSKNRTVGGPPNAPPLKPPPPKPRPPPVVPTDSRAPPFVDLPNRSPAAPPATPAPKKVVYADGNDNTTAPPSPTVPTAVSEATTPGGAPSTREPEATTAAQSEASNTSAPTAVASVPSAADLALTIVPVALICIMFGLGGIAAFLFRKRLCKKYKASKKKSNELKKKSGSREDSMGMQQWTPTNRYESWADSPVSPPPQNAPAPPDKPSDRWEFPRHQLKVFNILGEGCFGQVWKCQANSIDGNTGPTIVAVKTLKENAGERERSDLLQELQVMKSLDPHPNVVRLLGCCTDKDPIFVIMEYIGRGKLQSLLRSSRAQRCYDNLHGKSASLTSRNLTSFCYQVARGMHFLSNKGVIHRDLAARNVLVADDMTCKVADFGFARDILASHVYERKSEGRLPIRWMAPESLYDNLFSVKSDVWSFGVLVWEVVTLGSTPYPGLSAGEVMRRVRDGYRLDKPEHCRRELYNIMYYCWDRDPAKRPDFAEISSLLEQLLLSETDYIELQHFPDHSYYNIVSLSGEKL